MKKLGLLSFLLVGVIFVSSCGLREAKLVNKQEILIKKENKISVSYEMDNIQVFMSDTDSLVLEEYSNSKSKSSFAKIVQTDKDVTIKSGKRKKWLALLSQNNHAVVYLPQNYHGELEIETNSGSIKLKEALELSKLKTKQTSGSLKIEQLTAKEVIAETGSGSIKGQDIEVNNFKGISGSGSIKLDKVIGNADVKTNSGSIKTSFIEVDQRIEASTNSGSVKLELPKNLNFDFIGETSSGSFYTDFDMDLTSSENVLKDSVGDGDKKEIKIKTNSGNSDIVKN